MTIGSEPVSTLTLIMSSAVISAGVNVIWNAFAKWLDRRKEAVKEAQKAGHVYLRIVLHLETFARRCNEQLYDISVAMSRYYDHHDSSAFSNLSRIDFKFNPEPDWTALPVPFVAKVQTLTNRFEQCDSWIRMQFDLWADLDEAYQFEEERLAFYAQKACELASQIRLQIKAGKAETEDLTAHFQMILAQRRDWYQKNPRGNNLIPELRASVESEHLLGTTSAD